MAAAHLHDLALGVRFGNAGRIVPGGAKSKLGNPRIGRCPITKYHQLNSLQSNPDGPGCFPYVARTRSPQAPAALGPELLFLFVIAGAVGLMVVLSRRMAAPYTEQVFIDLRFRALPKYTMLSLARGFAAYLISLIFTLLYGTIAAHNQRAEKLMLPALDVLQAIPVLGFLPGLVLALVHLFHASEIGLEIACVVMIFTAQAWNMTFSFHGSLRTSPPRSVRSPQSRSFLTGRFSNCWKSLLR